MKVPGWVPAHVGDFLHYIIKRDFHGSEVNDPLYDWQKHTLSDLKRLSGIDDDRMRPVFKILSRMNLTRDQWFAFMNTAWTTIDDFSVARARNKQLLALEEKIKFKARELADLLNEVTENNWPLSWPWEFDRIGYLLEKTQSDDPYWVSMLERMAEVGELDIWQHQTPRLADCLLNLTDASERHSSKYQNGMIAAISVRQQNSKTEYIRAISENLILKEFDVNSTKIQEVIAITTEVALDNEDMVVSIDDVRQALRISQARKKD